ncbi:MAG: cohesin domain-containing protein [Saccharofermentanales bacterium]|jgi:hypothetical protein
MKTKTRIFAYILIISLIIAIGSTFSTAVYALDRQVTMDISKPSVPVGETFTLTLGFTPKALTRRFSFRIHYDNTLIQLINPCTNLSGIGAAISVGALTSSGQSIGIETGEEAMVGLAVRITFKALKQGSATIQVINASDGFDENKITNVPPHSSPLSRTVTITQQITTTTTTTTTTKSTTTTTRPTTTTTTTPRSTRSTTTTTTTPKSTSTTSTVPSTTPLVTPSVTPITTAPEELPEPVAWTGKRYDGELLSVPESMPSAERVPSSFSAVKVEHDGAEMDAFQSESLPYTLFWLKAEDDDDGRFYAYDDESGVFVPYFRSEWSSRFFTVTVLPENAVPDGFELTTLKVRGERVPVYRLLPGSFVPYEKYRSGYEEMDALSPTSGEDQGSDITGVAEPSESFSEENDSEARRQKNAGRYVYAAEGTDPEPAETENDRSDIPIPDPPENMVLLVCRVNDSEKKTLFLYDTVYDSLISVGSWPVPVRGSYLERSELPVPIVTEPIDETDVMTVPGAQVETLPSEPRQLSLFGLLLPPWVLVVAIVVLLLLILAVVFAVKSVLARRRHSFTFEEDDYYDVRDDVEDKGVLYIKGMKREYTRNEPESVREDDDFSNSLADESEYEEDVLADYTEEDEWVSEPDIMADFDGYPYDDDDVMVGEPCPITDFDDYSNDRDEMTSDSSLMEENDSCSQEQTFDDDIEDPDDDQDMFDDDDAFLSDQSVSDDSGFYYVDRDVDESFEESFDDQDLYDEDDEPSGGTFDSDASAELADDNDESEVDFSSHDFDRLDDVPKDVPSSEEVLHVRRRPSPDAMRRFPNMRQVFLQSPPIRQPESDPESDDRESYRLRSREDRSYFEEAYTDDDEI